MYKSQNFGQIVRLHREFKRLTLEKAAELCGISDKTLENIELGDSDPKLSTVIKIANTLEIHIGSIQNCIFTEKDDSLAS